jgi:hypothetical protein
MGSVDYGTQNITFDYLHPAKGANFNTLLLKGIRPGFYSGGAISASTGTTITIGAFTSYINTIDGTKTVRIATENAFNFTVTDSAPPGQTILIGITYEWLDQAANYFEPFQRTLGSAPRAGEILLGEVTIAGGVIATISYDYKTWGVYADDDILRIYDTLYVGRGGGEISGNIVIGDRLAYEANATGTDRIAIGAGALAGSSAYDNVVGLGAGSVVTGSNQLQLGNTSIGVYAQSALNVRSDGRDKADIKDCELGLTFINKLKPRQYRMNFREDYKGKRPTEELKRRRFHNGLIAQEVKEVMDEMEVDFAGYQDHAINGGQDVYTLAYEEFIPPLMKAVQELSTQVEELKAQLGKKKK